MPHGSLGPRKSSPPPKNGISVSSAVFAWLISVTNRQTDRPCQDTDSNKLHLLLVMQAETSQHLRKVKSTCIVAPFCNWPVFWPLCVVPLSFAACLKCQMPIAHCGSDWSGHVARRNTQRRNFSSSMKRRWKSTKLPRNCLNERFFLYNNYLFPTKMNILFNDVSTSNLRSSSSLKITSDLRSKCC